MQPMPLTTPEITNIVRRQVSQFVEIGLTHEAAVNRVAATLKVEPHKVAALAPPLSSEQVRRP